MNRYIELGYDVSSVVMAAIFWSVGIGLLCYANIRFKGPINPITAYSLYIFLFGYSIIPISTAQEGFTKTSYAIVIISIISFLAPILLRIKFSNIKVPLLSLKQRVNLLYFLLIGSCVVFVMECARFGFIPILEVASRDIYIETNEKLIPFLHYFIVLNSYIPCWAYLLYKMQLISKKIFLMVLCVSVIILLNYLSRQVYLLLGISMFISYCYYHRVKFASIIRISLISIGLFLFIGFLKFSSNVTDSFSEYMRLLAGIDNSDISMLEATVVEYSSKRFVAFNTIVDKADFLDYYGLGIYTFRPLLSSFFLEKAGIINRLPELDSEVLVTTYAADPYLDFGLIGVVIMNFFYGSLALGCYENFVRRRAVSIISWAIVLFCCVMGMFINYYNTMLICLGFIFNQLMFYRIEEIKK